MRKHHLYILAMLLILALPVAAQEGGTESPFNLGAGARELSLGSSAIARSSYATAPAWNPSRLVSAEQISLSAFHTNLYETDVAYQYVGMALPTMDFGSFGVGLYRLGISGIEERDQNNVLQGHTQDSRLAVYMAYARRVAEYDIGVSATMEYHTLGDFSATSSPGVNLSLTRAFGSGPDWFDNFTVSLNGRNLASPTLVLDQTEVRYPSVWDASASLTLLPNPSWNHSLSVSSRFYRSENLGLRTALGLEYSILETMYIRGGANDGHLAGGIGLSWLGIEFDYALVGRDLGSLHMFSLTTSFGTPVSVRRQRRIDDREKEFNRRMSQQLEQQNLTLVKELVAEGRAAMDREDWQQAEVVLDRASFLATGTEFDNAEIERLRREVGHKLYEWERATRLTALLDSATTKAQHKDYLASRYFASLAVDEFPDSEEANRLLREAQYRIDTQAEEERDLAAKLNTIDSLLGYGNIDQARYLAEALAENASEHEGVRSALRRTQLEWWRREASESFASQDYETVAASLDSMDLIFPDNFWSADYRGRLRAALQARAEPAVDESPETAQAPVLEGKLKEEVEALYKSAQQSFENGQLDRAIASWERIENITPNYKSVRDYLTEAYKYVGIELYGSNELAGAIEIWEKAIELRPERTEILNYLNRAKSELTKLRQLSYDQ